MAELTLGDQDRISIIISGVKGTAAGGRATRQVDVDENLKSFLETYGEGDTEVATPDFDALKALSKADPKAFEAQMAELTSKMVGSGAKSLPQRIVDATCEYLVKVHNFVISDKDPGSDHFYIAKGDLTPNMVKIPNDGVNWTVVAAAPFG